MSDDLFVSDTPPEPGSWDNTVSDGPLTREKFEACWNRFHGPEYEEHCRREQERRCEAMGYCEWLQRKGQPEMSWILWFVWQQNGAFILPKWLYNELTERGLQPSDMREEEPDDER